MKATMLRVLGIAAGLLFGSPCAYATAVTLKSQGATGATATAVIDARMNSSSPSGTYGSNANVRIDATNAALLRFAIFTTDGGPVPVGATINSATLKVYNTSGNTATIEAKRLLRSWVEGQASWNNAASGAAWSSAGAQGAGTDVNGTADGQGSVTPSSSWASIDVKASVQAFAYGTANHGWRLGYVSGDGAGTKSFASHEGSGSEEPVLEIDYTSTSTIVTLGASPYAASTDTWINSGSVNQNNGSDSDLDVSSSKAALIRFAIFASEGGPVPNDVIINSATLRLYNNGNDPVKDSVTVSATRMLRSWVGNEATWSNASTTPAPGVAWTTAGALGSGSDIAASADGQNLAAENSWWSVGVSASVRLFGGGSANNGWRLAKVSGNSASFNSGNAGSNRPRLVIDYSSALTLAASAAGSNQVNVSWSDVGSATGFKLERRTGVNGTWSEIAAPTGHTLAYADSGLTQSTAYYYRVKATTSWGETGYSNEAMAVATPVANYTGSQVDYTYDHFGNLVQTNAGGVITTLAYDLRGRKTGMADPDMGPWSYVYNALGELVSQTDAKSQTTTMAYDLLGRMTTRTEPDLVSTWTYDACAKGVGKLCSVSADNGYARTHGYDSLGRASTLSVTVDTGYSVSTTYDSAGRVDTLTYPTGFAVKHVYNASGYLAEVRNNADNALFWQAASQNAAGQVTGEALGNGLTVSRTYDTLFRLTAVSATGGAVTPHAQTFAYDAIGNLTQRADIVQGVTESFTYDSLNRLLSASGPALATRAWDYDAIGNITYKSDVGVYAYGSRPHAVANVGNAGAPNSITAAYSYDANGSLTAASGTIYPASGSVAFSRSLSYTSFNLPGVLTHVQGGSTYSYTYTYSAEHERVRLVTARPDDTLTSIYLHPAGKGALLYEKETRQSNGLIQHKHFVTGGAGLVGVFVTKSSYGEGEAPEMRYYHKDHLGSIAVITNPAGAVIEALAYEAFGERRHASGAPEDRSAPLIGVTTDRGFTSHEHLDEMMLVHMNGRIYDPVLGRFMTADPYISGVTDLQSFNRYSYTNNNPLAYTDPSGYFKLSDIIKVAAAVAIAIYAPQFLGDFFISSATSSFLAGGGISTAFVTIGIGDAAIFSGLGSFLTGAVGGFGAALIGSGGDFEMGLKGALSGGLFGLAGGVGGEFSAERLLAHAGAGCVQGELMGGGCGGGAVSAVAGKASTILSGGNPIAAVVAGGTVSVIGGGKFGNGAVTAAFGYLFNCGATDCWRHSNSDLPAALNTDLAMLRSELTAIGADSEMLQLATRSRIVFLDGSASAYGGDIPARFNIDTNRIEVYSSYFGFGADARQFILGHELAHMTAANRGMPMSRGDYLLGPMSSNYVRSEANADSITLRALGRSAVPWEIDRFRGRK